MILLRLIDLTSPASVCYDNRLGTSCSEKTEPSKFSTDEKKVEGKSVMMVNNFLRVNVS